MNNFNYQKICSELLSGLKERQREVISRRFGLKGREPETLESIGQDFGICRERVRQIESASLKKIRPKTEEYQKIYQVFSQYLKKSGGLKKEEILLEELGGEGWQNEVSFLLSLRKPFQRISEKDNFYSFWTIDRASIKEAEKTVHSLQKKLESKGKPVVFKEIKSFFSLSDSVLISYLEASKIIEKNSENLFGLRDWPEINPRGIKDKAYLVFQKAQKPLHFAEVATLIEGSHTQTVHNELIKDSRFVLVGRGIYALKEWGYYPGQVRDVISKVLEESEEPLTKGEILNKVLEQRLVKENTVLLNLSNRKYFSRDSEGRYSIKEG